MLGLSSSIHPDPGYASHSVAVIDLLTGHSECAYHTPSLRAGRQTLPPGKGLIRQSRIMCLSRLGRRCLPRYRPTPGTSTIPARSLIIRLVCFPAVLHRWSAPAGSLMVYVPDRMDSYVETAPDGHDLFPPPSIRGGVYSYPTIPAHPARRHLQNSPDLSSQRSVTSAVSLSLAMPPLGMLGTAVHTISRGNPM